MCEIQYIDLFLKIGIFSTKNSNAVNFVIETFKFFNTSQDSQKQNSPLEEKTK